MGNVFYEKMFTDSVKAAQEYYGSREAYERIEANARRSGPTVLGDAEKDFIGSRDGFYMATVNEDGRPYVQFRGGPPGFLRALDEKTLGYADFRGNLQYISVGNLSGNDKAALFLIDYANRRRLKIAATVEIRDVKDDPDLVERLRVPGYDAKIERAITFNVEAFDWNCPQHITPRYTVDEIGRMLAPLNDHFARLEAENASLKKAIRDHSTTPLPYVDRSVI